MWWPRCGGPDVGGWIGSIFSELYIRNPTFLLFSSIKRPRVGKGGGGGISSWLFVSRGLFGPFAYLSLMHVGHLDLNLTRITDYCSSPRPI